MIISTIILESAAKTKSLIGSASSWSHWRLGRSSSTIAMISGSIGLLPSASLREDKFGMYEPIHGSAPDIQGQGKANPIATLLSLAMMFRYSFGMENIASKIECSVGKVLDNGNRTADIYTDGTKLVNTGEMGDLVLAELKKLSD